MTDPTPGKPFEARGLRWEPARAQSGCACWRASIGASVTLDSTGTWSGGCETADKAIAWAIRTCPGARCGSCKHRQVTERRHASVTCRQWCFELDQNEDGYCHKYEARRDDGGGGMSDISGAYLLAKRRKFVAYDADGNIVRCPMSLAKYLVRAWSSACEDPGRYDGVHWTPKRLRLVFGCNGSGTGAVTDV